MSTTCYMDSCKLRVDVRRMDTAWYDCEQDSFVLEAAEDGVQANSMR